MVNQRSKSGCWTCRLRRKKCAEDGLPCSNCETRGVDCHGYGPRPAWKDRGHQEKQEADRLQLRRRNQATRRPSSSNTTDATVENSIYCLSPSMAFASPTADLASSSFPSSSVETPIFPFPSGSPSHLDPSDLTLLPDFWVPDFEEAPGTSPFCDNPSITIPAPPGNTLENAPQDQDLTPLASFIEAGVTSLEFPSNRLHPSEEREVELMMQYLEEDFPKQHPSYCPSAVRVQAWLMCTFRRSRTFLYASLCISAYFNFLKAPSHDGARQTELFREYDRLKHMAAKAHALLMEASSKRESQKLTRDELDFMLGETIIASVQLAILESLGENHDNARSYLDSASHALIQCHERGSFVNSQQMILPTASVMERKAVEFFTGILIWIHVLHCSTKQTTPLGAAVYRQLLAPGSPFVKSFIETVGFEGWVLTALMDTIEVSIWKREQETKNRLSMRELIGRMDTIISTLHEQMEQSDHVQTKIFAHAVAIHAHTITSGHLPAVPEIKQTLDKAIPLWESLSPSHNNLKRLSWAFCVSASLASGVQRSVFERVLFNAASNDVLSSTVSFLTSVMKECWKMLDAGAPSCNWQMVMQKMDRNIHGILFI